MSKAAIGGVLSLLLFGLMLTGCENEAPVTATKTSDYAAQRDALKRSLEKKQKTAGAERTTLAAEGEPGESMEDVAYAGGAEGYAYDATGKRDPFRSIRYKHVQAMDVGIGPLGEYELGQLSVIAVVWDATRPRALVSDPSGRSFVIREGSQIGKNSGRVIHIGDNLVLVKETYVDFEGTESTRDVEMRIRRSQGG